MASFLNSTSNRIGTTVNNIAGKAINEALGLFSENIPLYDRFLYDILSDAENAVTEPAYWVAFFTKNIKNAGIVTNITSTKTDIFNQAKSSFLNQFGVGGLTKNIFPNGAKTTADNTDYTPWNIGIKSENAKDNFYNKIERTIMLIQGIEIPGDGFLISREGIDNNNIGGFLRPPITRLRNDMPEMEITFLENNNSVADLVIRPWIIDSSYQSLKFANKSTITCYNLTRSPSGFRLRKKFIFYNAVPVSIDAEKYTYESGASYGKRQAKFVFTHYSMEDGNAMRDDLKTSVKNVIAQTGRNFLNKVVESGTDVIAGGANQVYVNVKGAFVDSVNDHVQNVQSRVREATKDAEDSIIDKSQRFIDKAIGFNPEKDSLQGPGTEFSTAGVENNPSPRLNILTSSDDSIAQKPIPPKSTGVSNNVRYVIKKINENDTVDSSSLNLKEINIKQNDIVDSNSVNSKNIKIDENDIVESNSVNSKNIKIDENDTVSKTIKFKKVNINQNDNVTSNSTSVKNIKVDENDTNSNLLKLKDVKINNNDTSVGIKTKDIIPPSDDNIRR